LVLVPGLVPHKWPMWSHKTARVVPGWDHEMCPVVPGVAACGTRTARRVASGGGLSPHPLAPPMGDRWSVERGRTTRTTATIRRDARAAADACPV